MKKIIFTLFICLIVPTLSFAAHPLITDDTGTQGSGKFQLELNGEYGVEKESGTTEKAFEVAPTLSYGVTDKIDLVLSIPYQYIKIEDGGSFKESGVSDASLEVKYRFFDEDGLSFAIKPGISLPTGDENKGLGTGKVGYSAYFITTKEIKPLYLHLNIGYIRNENKFDERKNIWHASIAGEFEATEKFKLVANIGTETNPDKTSNNKPAFALAGIIYAVTENISFDVGYKYGLNTPETDNTYLLGLAIKF